MKKSKKFLCLLLALVMAGSLLLLPAAAANTEQSGAERYPTVYVHGLMGWGARDQIYAVTPYWGLTSDLMPYLTGKGYESYAASVGPLSSAWDRACELYAQLTGTTVDYGAAHAAEYGHARMTSRCLKAGARTRRSTSSATASAAQRSACFWTFWPTALRRSRLRPRPTARRSPRFSRAARPTGSIR